MIRHIVTIFLFIVSLTVIGQPGSPSLDNIRAAAGKSQWTVAKTEIEKYLANEINAKNAEAWYLKSLIYYKILISPSAPIAEPDGHAHAFAAYKKYLEIKDKEKDTSRREHEILFGISFNTIDKANNEFRNKRFHEALKAFQQVEEMENFIVKKGFSYQGFSFPAFDTQLYVNIAAAAISAGREDVALNYYRKIADNKILSPGFHEIYRYLVDQFDKKGDKPTRDKYIAIGKTTYPEDEFWCQVVLKDAGADKKKLFARYEELIAGDCNIYLINFNYAAELYNYSFKQNTRPADFSKLQSRIPMVLKKTIAIRSTADANLLMCRYQLALINDLIDAYNAVPENSADKAKKREGLTAQINQRYEDVYLYASNAYNNIDASKLAAQPKEKENYITACKILSDYWERKNDKGKAKEYQEKARVNE
ncbi:MAG TPA: hypothetical protein VF487_04720 [Chitinophagaceae bacterium]